MDWNEKASLAFESILIFRWSPDSRFPVQIIPHWVVMVSDHKGVAGVLGYRVGSP